MMLRGRRIVVAGRSDAGGDTDFAVTRHRAGGALDKTFSGDGVRLIDFGADEFPAAVAGARRGRILVAGTKGGAQSKWALARLRRGGALDGSFSGDGRKVTNPGGMADSLAGVVGAGKKIVVAGETNRSGNRRFGLARYRWGGGLDSSFSGDGIKSFTLRPGSQSEGARDLARQPNGRLVAVGFTFGGGTGDQALVRLRP